MTRRRLRRLVRVAGPAVVALAACAAVAMGATASAPGETPALARIMAVCALTLLAAAIVIRRIRFVPASARAQRVSRVMALAPSLIDLEVALVLIGGLYAVFERTGGIESPLYPLLYAVIAFSAAFQRRVAAVTAVAAALALELALLSRSEWPHGLAAAGTHAAFCLASAFVHVVFLRGQATALRADHERRIDDEIRHRRESARDFRLIASALSAESRPVRSREAEEDELAAGSVETIRSIVFYSLSLLKRSLGARTAILLWLDDQAESLKIKELVTDSDAITERPRIAIAGALGAVVRDRSVLSLAQTRPGQITYYDSPPVAALVAAPVMDGAHLRGVLCVDREQPFEDRDAALVARAAEQVVVAVRSERVFTAVEHAKYEHERFYHASAMLVRALTLEQVMETAFDAAAQIVDHDAAVIALYDQVRHRHRIYAVRLAPGKAPVVKLDALTGLEFRDNAGLASMVVKNRHHLPATGELRDATTPVFTKRVPFRGAESLLVLPLVSADEAIGTLTLAAREPHRFRRDIREMLGVIANQVAISIQNAIMYKKMETMATTDGLTGLTNHRTFQERFSDLLARSARHGHTAAVLLCDVDHFKKVNDTYGHPVGDEVLRRVARVLQEAVRKIDIPARYGGEEFAVVLEATDLEGAMRLAERIRADVGALELDSDKGRFQVTMSIGVAAFPDDARDQAMLIEHADHALYHAKQTGRNRVVSYQQFVAARRARKAM